MPILSIQTAQPTGLASVSPSVVYIFTNDTYATVTATGYLTQQSHQGFTFSNQQMALVYTSDEGCVWLKVVITFSGASVLNTVVSLVQISSPGDVVLPTIANHFIASLDAAGTLGNLTGTLIQPGSLQAGLSGIPGGLISYPRTAAKGLFVLQAVDNIGDTPVTLSNVPMGQPSAISIPDPANAIGHLLIGATATPFVSGNFPQNSGTAGLMIDSGVAVSALARTANVVLLAPLGDQTITTNNLTLTLGNFVAAAGNISATLGSLAAGTTVTARSGISTSSGPIQAVSGSVTAGSSGFAGTLVSFPATAANGSLILAAANVGGAFNLTISNSVMGQSSVVSVPDPANAAGRFLIGAGATPFVNGNFPVNSGNAGLMVDSGIAASSIQLNANIKAVRSADIGGAGAGPITITQAGVVATSVITANIVSSSNIVSVAKVTPGTGDFTILFDADPGASCIINYVVFIAQQ